MLLAGLGRLTAARLDEALGREGLSLRHLGALGHLRRDPGLSYSELGRRARVTVQSMQATVAQLEASGAVARRSAGGRGRTAQLEVTQAGLEALARVEVVVAQLEDQLLGRLSDDERAELTDVLARVLRAASAG
jgi:DNA-binding MarR family transcriptional regulator